MVIRCSERGLSGIAIKFLKEELKFRGRPYPIIQPGGPHDLINGSPEIKKHNQKRIRTILIEAGIARVAIFGHDLCIIYNDEHEFASLNEEREKQIRDMKKIKAIINKNHPGIIVYLIYGYVIDAKERIFDLKLIEE